MRVVKALWPLIAVAVVALAIVVLAEPVSKWMAARRAHYNGVVVGYIVKAEGGVRRIHGADVELVPSPVVKKVEIRDGDRVQTSIHSKAVILLNSADEMNLGSGTAVQFQLWNPQDANSPIYVNWMLGSVESVHPGVKGKAYLVKDGRLYSPGQKPLEKAMALTVLKNAPLDMQLGSQLNKPDSDLDAGASTGVADDDPAAMAANLPAGADPETLSNEYIDETVGARQNQLQKCWLSRLKEINVSKGQIVVQFEITKRGKVREARVADSSLQDQLLQKCVVSVFERIQFRPFKGADISLSYPVNFE